HFSVWITAFLFSVIHMQYHAVLPRFFLGAFIGYVFVYSGSLRSSIYVHFFYNTILILLSYFIQHNLMPAYLESFGVNDWSVFLVSLLVLFGTSYSLVKPLAQK
ncbi:MAG: CPBP family intramembrane metalloprotease, partial [Flavobacteriales bacterium]